MMGEEELEILYRVNRGQRLPLADRKQDRIRQRLRRDGLIECVMNPRRWVLTEAGKATLDRHLWPAAGIEGG